MKKHTTCGVGEVQGQNCESLGAVCYGKKRIRKSLRREKREKAPRVGIARLFGEMVGKGHAPISRAHGGVPNQ